MGHFKRVKNIWMAFLRFSTRWIQKVATVYCYVTSCVVSNVLLLMKNHFGKSSDCKMEALRGCQTSVHCYQATRQQVMWGKHSALDSPKVRRIGAQPAVDNIQIDTDQINQQTYWYSDLWLSLATDKFNSWSWKNNLKTWQEGKAFPPCGIQLSTIKNSLKLKLFTCKHYFLFFPRFCQAIVDLISRAHVPSFVFMLPK